MQIDSANKQTCKHFAVFTHRISLGFAIRLFIFVCPVTIAESGILAWPRTGDMKNWSVSKAHIVAPVQEAAHM